MRPVGGVGEQRMDDESASTDLAPTADDPAEIAGLGHAMRTRQHCSPDDVRESVRR